MRAGDFLFLSLALGTLILVLIDAAMNGAIGQWASDNLYTNAHAIGSMLGLLGKILAPVLLLPLLTALAGQFVSLPAPINSVQKLLIGWIDTANLHLGGAARWFALGLVMVTAIIVIQRYVFGFASTKLQESVIYMHALLFLLASASTLLADGHVRVDIFYAKQSEKGKAWTDLWGTYLTLIPMCGLILITSTGYIDSAWRILEQSRESDGLPLVYLLKTAIPLFAVMMILQGFSIAARCALTLSGVTPPARPSLTGEAEI